MAGGQERSSYVRTVEVVGRFLHKEPAGLASVSTDGTVLSSYGVPIAKWQGDAIRVFANGPNVSKTTRRQTTLLRDMARSQGVKVVIE